MKDREYLDGPDDDFTVEITSLDTPERSQFASDRLLQGTHLAPKVRIGLTILSILGGLLLIFVVLSPILSSLLPKKTSAPAIFHPPVQIQNVDVQNGIAYITSSDGTFRALNMKNGSLLWQHQAAGPIGAAEMTGTVGSIGPVPLFLNDNIYMGYHNQHEYVIQLLKANNGKVLWTFKSSSNSIPLIIDDGGAYALFRFPLQGHTLTALNSKNGTELWHYTINKIPASSNIDIQGIEDKIYVAAYTPGPTQKTDFSVLRMSDGSLLWHVKAVEAHYVQSNLVSITTNNNVINMVRADNGHAVWHYQSTSSANVYSSMDENFFYMQTQQGWLQALRADNGALAWTYKSSWGIAQIFPEVDGVLYLQTGNSFIVALRASDGKQLWHVQPIAPPFTFGQAQVMNEVVYIFTSIGDEQYETVAALRASNGSLLWRRNINTYNNSMGVQIINNQLFVDTGSSINALSSTTGSPLWHVNYAPTTSQYGSSLLAFTDDLVILRSSDSVIEAHTLETGTLLWHYPHGN